MNVDNHRHCQATVLGATGSEPGTGQTWPTLQRLSLPNLPSNWLSNFRDNINITDDLADILRLIDWTSGMISNPKAGDLISISDRNGISVRNLFSPEYEGLVGISGSKPNRALVEKNFTFESYGNGRLIATIRIGNDRFEIRDINDYVPIYYTVTFYDMDETTILDQQSILEGNDATAPNPNEHEGYTFIRWEPSSFTNITRDMNVYARYEEIQPDVPPSPPQETYKVTFKSDGFSDSVVEGIEYGTKFGTISQPNWSRTNYRFDGWQLNNSPISDNYEITDDIVVVAKWTYIPPYIPPSTTYYRVTYYKESGGDYVGYKDVASGTSFNNISHPSVTKTGYTFVKWTLENGTTPTTITGDVNVYGNWNINQYTATFNANGGQGGTSTRQNYGTPLTAPNVTYAGHQFVRWEPAVPATMPANDVTYTAQWEEVTQHTVRFFSNSSRLHCYNTYNDVEDGSTKIVNDPQESDLTFTGWVAYKKDSSQTSSCSYRNAVTEDVDYCATWRTDVTSPQITARKLSSGSNGVPQEHELKQFNNNALPGAIVTCTQNGITWKHNDDDTPGHSLTLNLSLNTTYNLMNKTITSVNDAQYHTENSSSSTCTLGNTNGWSLTFNVVKIEGDCTVFWYVDPITFNIVLR